MAVTGPVAIPSLVALVLLAAPSSTPRVVHRSEMRAAMEARRGYDLTATTNGARFQAEVLLDLLRKPAARATPRGHPCSSATPNGSPPISSARDCGLTRPPSSFGLPTSTPRTSRSMRAPTA